MCVFAINMARGVHLLWLLVVAYFGCQIFGLQEQGLDNEHVRVVLPKWFPFIDFYCSNDTNWDSPTGSDCPNGTENVYNGILWDLLMLMKQHRNVSYTLIDFWEDGWGGTCYDSNNCTGMIGMVNRDEADLAIGLIK